MTRPKRQPGVSGWPIRRGAAAVELALVLPLLLLLVAMILDFARVFHTTQVLNTAACNGVAHTTGAAYDPDSADPGRAAACRAGEALTPALRADQVTVASADGLMTVTVRYDCPMLTGFSHPDGAIRLERSATRTVAAKVGD